MNLFLEGQKGIGKTTMILSALQSSGLKVAGFQSIRLLNADGETMSFYLAKAGDYFSGTMSVDNTDIDRGRIFLAGGKERRQVNLAAFENLPDYIGDYENADVILLDEIGGLELMVPEVYGFLENLLTGPYNCIGTFKSQKNHNHMQNHVDKSIDETEAHRLRKLLLETNNSSILEVIPESKGKAELAVYSFLKTASENRI